KWQGELTSPNHLERAGWTKSTIKVGDEVTMSGSALKSGTPAMQIRKLSKNGELVPTGGGEESPNTLAFGVLSLVLASLRHWPLAGVRSEARRFRSEIT